MNDRCDVLVVGAGGAGLRAAIAAYEAAPDLQVVLATKGALGESGVTATAYSDRMAFHATLPGTEPGGPDAWRYHADDIYRIGGHVSDADLAEVLARGAAEAFDYLDRLGVPWARRPDGSVDQFVTDGSAYARACYTGPDTAHQIEAALIRRLRALPVRVLERCMVAELLRDAAGRVVGAALVSEEDGSVSAMSAGAVVLATGGAGQAFAVNVFPPDCTGDGYALAYRAGAELVNLEFIQIGLCSTATGLACSGDMMRALPRLVNDRDQELLLTGTAELPAERRMELLFSKGASWPVSYREPSHRLDIAATLELRAGRRVYLDYRSNPAGYDPEALPTRVVEWYAQVKGVDLGDSSRAGTPLDRLRAINPASVRWLADRGLRLEEGQPVEIAPAIQHFQGGVKIGVEGQTSVPGLYAAGEAAGGQHGANRPGGNALLDSQVFGRIAGESAARWARTVTPLPIAVADAQRAVDRLLRPGGQDPAEVRRRVAEAMARDCGVHRTEEGLRALCDALEDMAAAGVDGAAPGAATHRAVEALNLLTVGRLVARAAMERDESRGPHLRFASAEAQDPLPRRDPEWQRYLVLRGDAQGRPTVERRTPHRPA